MDDVFFVILKNCETNYYDELLNVIKKKRLDIEIQHMKREGEGKFGKYLKKRRKYLSKMNS